MKSTYSIEEAQNQFATLVHEAETGGMATVTHHDKVVAYVMGAADLAGLIKNAEILANPFAQKAIADAEAGRGRVYPLSELGE